MTDNTHKEHAITSLQELGLSGYEAKCFVGLTRLSSGTAKEISEITDVPRSRVYDSVEKLQRRGLADVQNSTPRKYRSVPVETAVRAFRNEFDSNVETASRCLRQVQSPSPNDDGDLWTISGRENVTDRGSELISEADTDLYLGLSDSVADAGLEWVRAATDRNLDLTVSVSSQSLEQRVEQFVPRTDVTDRTNKPGPSMVHDASVGRVLLADGTNAVVSSVEGVSTSVERESAVLARDGSVGTGIVAMLREVQGLTHAEPPATAKGAQTTGPDGSGTGD
ncbi:TrmB family transcriptional regulator [Halorussus halophilus]|uniref:TrmB family transcriptional regulator n=1 Tax=Halorussus halophilus TaxID=2650975 RepID=UPI0017881B35|nr:TrmB family transcriptional regulator [Halorussus halophilus]